MTETIRDNTERHRFELDVNGQVVFANYRRQGPVLAITYVEAPPPLRGKGWSDKLMHAIAETARREERKIAPLCGYASAWLRSKKAYRDLLA
jgi:predicted GNAT family acetyltransferase